MSNWWESKDDGGATWNDDSTADTSWRTEEAAPDSWGKAEDSSSDIATKIKQLREGKWSEGWKAFEYWDESTGSMVASELDPSIGSRGWWPFLVHDGQEWQPEDLAAHLEKQMSSTSEATQQWGSNESNDKWGAQQSTGGGDSWGASANNSWGASGDAAPAPSGRAFWEMQKYNVEQGVLSRKEEWELEQDDSQLFTERLGSNAGIDFEAYNNVPVDVSGDKSQNIPSLNTFEEIYNVFSDIIPDACVANVRRCQYQVPTPVQKYAVPVGLAGRDVMCCAQTGSGKTAAFLIPVIGRMMQHHANPVGSLTAPFEGKCKPDTLVMTPTRELCIQIHEEAQKMCHRTDYRCCRVYGGEATKIQLEDLSKGCDLMAACPGRLQDFINRDVIDISTVYVLVLDEADRMLDMGFEKQIRDIVEGHGMPSKENRQTMMFSATFPEECQKMAQDFLYDYIWIGVGVVGGAVSTVTQSLKAVPPAEKYAQLIEVLDNFYENRKGTGRCLVFVNAKDTAKWLDEQLYEKNMDSGALHGNLTQEERERNLTRFRKGDIDVMIATDVAARGLDIEKVDLVVNYDMPSEVDTYVHRIGRSGRIGNRGAAITFISTDENSKCYENADVLRKLLVIMRDVGSEIPQWFEDTVSGDGAGNGYGKDYGAGGGGWSNDNNDSWANWGGKDMRAKW